MSKKTLVLGASLNEDRYSNMVLHKLHNHHIETVAIGLREGDVAGISIEKDLKPFTGIHTVTMYINAARQPDYYDYILSLKPQRVLFNPGTENPAFKDLLQQQDIQVEDACTLVLLSTGQY